MNGSPALQVVGLAKRFGQDAPAVDDVSFAVQAGEIVSVLGPSGCGKTTTMRIIAGLEQADAGDVLLLGRSLRNVPPHRRNIGLVFQDLAIFPHKTVRENIAFGLKMKGIKGDAARRRVDAALELVELSVPTFASRMPSELSGGQRQRVAVARTIVVEPSLVLFDEPMAALDRRLRDRMAIELRRIQKQLGLAAVYVTHDQETASMMSDRIAVMGKGRILQIAPPLDIYRNPADRFVADFIGDMNFIPAAVAGFSDGLAVLEVDGNRISLPATQAPAEAAATLAIRPEHITLHPERPPSAIVQGRLKSVQFVGGSFVHRLDVASGPEIVVRSLRNQAAVGDLLWIGAEASDIRVLAA